jgi:ribosome-associated toxin RatA of RatAB toxin-antitoxin module
MAEFERTLRVEATAEQMWLVAGKPELAPNYLNFVKSVELLRGDASGPHTIRVHVVYRNPIEGSVELEVTPDHQARTLTVVHAGGQFVDFQVVCRVTAADETSSDVTISCSYTAKLPLISWLVSMVLGKALRQIADAMASYARSLSGVRAG